MVAMYWCLQSGVIFSPKPLQQRLQQNRSDRFRYFWTRLKLDQNRSDHQHVFNLMMSRLFGRQLAPNRKALLSMSKETRVRS